LGCRLRGAGRLRQQLLGLDWREFVQPQDQRVFVVREWAVEELAERGEEVVHSRLESPVFLLFLYVFR
jgi:hypothetical protein